MIIWNDKDIVVIKEWVMIKENETKVIKETKLKSKKSKNNKENKVKK
jgi:hypothetical protein